MATLATVKELFRGADLRSALPELAPDLERFATALEHSADLHYKRPHAQGKHETRIANLQPVTIATKAGLALLFETRPGGRICATSPAM